MNSRWETLALGSETESTLWELFHENSKLGRFSSARTDKELKNHMAGLLESLPFEGFPTVTLPKRLPPLQMPVGKAMQCRVSVREMSPQPLHMKQLAALLHYGYGITRRVHKGSRSLRTVPSAGALYPLEIFVQVRDVRHLGPGLYHYDPPGNHLHIVREGDQTEVIVRCLAQNTIPKHASLLVFITALFERSTFKYGERGYRFALIEAGHIAQNINLACSAFGLGSTNIGGFFDREVDAFLQLDGITHSNIYIIAIGKKSDRGSAGRNPLKKKDLL